MAWVAWKDGYREDVVARAGQALKLWDSIAVTYHFKGLCLWPLMSVYMASGQLAEAVDASCQILRPAQARLPDELESLLAAAKAAWDRDEHGLAAGHHGGSVGAGHPVRLCLSHLEREQRLGPRPTRPELVAAFIAPSAVHSDAGGRGWLPGV